MRTRVYRNEDVERVIAFIPVGHKHLRLILEMKDQTIVLQEATVAAIVRAYVSVAIHPTRRVIELVRVKPAERKPGYAEDQLIESGKDESEALAEAQSLWLNAEAAIKEP
ncbi:MAG: hypothetical protein NZ954_01445 [Thermofilaceae archaeon]|nr:hypothetical protein [Thermofilaceae archaeon]MCX8180465.1 hypothetical protein [Thermofilaceae archaeon]MDW8003338.1 hypothetical protein [Thermofilaceae archaeon]